MTVTIYHNPRCSKSRQTLALLNERGVEPKIIPYLTSPPSVETLTSIIRTLGMTPRDVIRKKEAPYQDLDLANKDLSNDALIEAMVSNPILIERPIVVKNNKAAIGRPPEAVLAIL